MRQLTRGFTLVEILVALGIVTALATVVFVSGSESRAKAQDTKRQTDLKQLQLAIRIYQEQNDGAVPSAGCGQAAWASEGTGNGGVCLEYIDGLAPEFIATLPRDPNIQTIGGNTFGYSYRTTLDGLGWKMLTYGASDYYQIESHDDEFARCPADCAGGGNSWCEADHAQFSTTFAVYNDSGRCL